MTPDAITIVVPTRNQAAVLPEFLAKWDAYLPTLGRELTCLLVDDGSTDGTQGIGANFPAWQVLSHATPQGFGACLRTALPHAPTPLIFVASPNYPYEPADLAKLLARIDDAIDVYGTMMTPVAASGCRTGRAAPRFWRAVGVAYRLFCRVLLGAQVEPIPGWLGLREHVRGWLVWLWMGVPLNDVNSHFKLFRREVFDKFPLQSDSEFVNAEIFAKLTFLTQLVAEENLTPCEAPAPPAAWGDYRRVLGTPKFASPLAAP